MKACGSLLSGMLGIMEWSEGKLRDREIPLLISFLNECEVLLK